MHAQALHVENNPDRLHSVIRALRRDLVEANSEVERLEKENIKLRAVVHGVEPPEHDAWILRATRDHGSYGCKVPMWTGHERSMIECMLLARGRAVTKESLYSYLYQGRDECEIKIVDVFICKIRKKIRLLEEQALLNGSTWSVVTHWGRGYSLVETKQNQNEEPEPSGADVGREGRAA